MPAHLKDALRQEAARQHRSFSGLVVWVLMQWCEYIAKKNRIDDLWNRQ